MVPQRQLNKAIYLLLERYHRTYGLKLYGFGGPHGYGYGLFYLDAVPPDPSVLSPYASHSDEELALVIYLCNLELPAFAHGEQLIFKGSKSPRTSAIVEWWNKHLSLSRLFYIFSDEIARWRSQYTVEQSEKYMLMINLAGLHCARSGQMLYKHDAVYSEYDIEYQTKTRRIVDQLQMHRSYGDIWGLKDIQFSSNGLALLNCNQVVDVWGMHISGIKSEKILQ